MVFVFGDNKRKLAEDKKATHVISISWTHEKETSNALLYMSIIEYAEIPHPSVLFRVTLRGERLSRQWTRESKAQGQAKPKDAPMHAVTNSNCETRKDMHVY